MALVCPADHPPGVGTTYCRLCGRTYIEVVDQAAPAALALLGAGPVARVESPPPFPALPVQTVAPRTAPLPPAAPATPPSPSQGASPAGHRGSAPQQPAVPVGPPAGPPAVPAAAPPGPPVQVVPVQATLGMQVHLPLVEMPVPSPTSTTPLDLGGPVLHAPEDVEAPTAVRRQLDRAAVMAGVLGGVVGGAVSGAAVALLLT